MDRLEEINLALPFLCRAGVGRAVEDAGPYDVHVTGGLLQTWRIRHNLSPRGTALTL